MGSSVSVIVRGAEMGGLSASKWLLMGLGMEGAAALVYAYYWVFLRKLGGYGAGSVLGSAILSAAGGVVFFVVALVAWLKALF